jgi:hypothetical protein
VHHGGDYATESSTRRARRVVTLPQEELDAAEANAQGAT